LPRSIAKIVFMAKCSLNKFRLLNLCRPCGEHVETTITHRLRASGFHSFLILRPWSDKDLDILKKLHPTEKFRVIAEKLGRSAKAVDAMAIRLGLRKQKASVSWSKQEEALVRKLYPHKSHQEIADQMGRSIPAILGKAHKFGLRRKMGCWHKGFLCPTMRKKGCVFRRF